MQKKRPSNQPIRKAIEKVIGKKLPKTLHIDHKIPLKDGGKHVLSNIQVIPKKLHEQKTSMENRVRAVVKKIKKRK